MNNSQNVQNVHIASLGSNVIASATSFASEVFSNSTAPVSVVARVLSTTLSLHGVYRYILNKMNLSVTPEALDVFTELHDSAYASLSALADRLPSPVFRTHAIAAITKVLPNLSPDDVSTVFDRLDDDIYDRSELVDYLFDLIDDYTKIELDKTINLIYDERNTAKDEGFVTDLFEYAARALYKAVRCCIARLDNARACSEYERQLRLLA